MGVMRCRAMCRGPYRRGPLFFCWSICLEAGEMVLVEAPPWDGWAVLQGPGLAGSRAR